MRLRAPSIHLYRKEDAYSCTRKQMKEKKMQRGIFMNRGKLHLQRGVWRLDYRVIKPKKTEMSPYKAKRRKCTIRRLSKIYDWVVDLTDGLFFLNPSFIMEKYFYRDFGRVHKKIKNKKDSAKFSLSGQQKEKTCGQTTRNNAHPFLLVERKSFSIQS